MRSCAERRLLTAGPAKLLTASLIATLLSCGGDTLYDAPPTDVPPPSVSVFSPTTGATVLAGRTLRVRASASDTLGVTSLQVDLRGAFSASLQRKFDQSLPQVTLDTTIIIPEGTSGAIAIEAIAKNSRGASSKSDVVSINVGADVTSPVVEVTSTVPARMELTDSIRVRVTAEDNGGGIATVGASILIRNAARTDTVVAPGTVRQVEPAETGTAVFEFSVAPLAVTAASLPGTLTVEVYGYAIDSAGNCGAAVSGGSRSVACVNRIIAGNLTTVAAQQATPQQTLVVAGRSFPVPSAGVIRDAAADAARGRLYLSNTTQGHLEVFDLRANRFLSRIRTGAAPWGLAFNRSRDTLIVANSGGTNVSYVPLNATVAEAVPSRMRPPNIDLFDVELTDDGKLKTSFHDFSDRPESVAQDAAGRVIFSTLPTAAASAGTVRVAEMQPGWSEPEVRLLMTEFAGSFSPEKNNFAIANIDSLRAFFNLAGGPEVIELYDHRPGFPDQIIRSGMLPIRDAIEAMMTLGSDIVWRPGKWNVGRVAFKETSFVVASGDHRFVAIAEGDDPSGRVAMWSSDRGTISSNEIAVADIVGNTSEQLLSLDLNVNGSLGVIRGLKGAYYFTNDLRMQGSRIGNASTTSGAGAVIDLQNPGIPVTGPFPPSSATTLSYVATTERTIRIVDTTHFSDRGEIVLKDNIVGPLRVSSPIAGEPCGAAGCPVAKLYGVTNAGAVVVVDVLASDIRP